jgi:hypothetical protein
VLRLVLARRAEPQPHRDSWNRKTATIAIRHQTSTRVGVVVIGTPAMPDCPFVTWLRFWPTTWTMISSANVASDAADRRAA